MDLAEFVVEADRESAREGFAGALKTAAANGAEAVALFRQHANEVRLFISDGAMPVMDGPGAIIELRRLQPSLPVILTSGEGSEGPQPVEGAVVVAKPFALEEILGAVHRSLSQSA